MKYTVTTQGRTLGKQSIGPHDHLRDPKYDIKIIARYLASRKTPATSEEIFAKLKRTTPLDIFGRWPSQSNVQKDLIKGMKLGYFKSV